MENVSMRPTSISSFYPIESSSEKSSGITPSSPTTDSRSLLGRVSRMILTCAKKVMATLGNIDAQFELGESYLTGSNGIDKNLDKALHWFGKAGNQRDVNAQIKLAHIYLEGLHGVEKDVEKGFHWLKKASQLGDREASFNIAEIYRYGLFEVEESSLGAQHFFQLAARTKELLEPQNDKIDDEIQRLAVMHLNGSARYLEKVYSEGLHGVEKDPSKGLYWKEKAAKQRS